MNDLTCFNWVQLIKKSDLPANAKYLALYLSTWMNAEQQVAWPSVMRISNETGLSEPTVIKWLNHLDLTQWIIKKKAAAKVFTNGGSQAHNEYWVNVPQEVLRGLNDLSCNPKGGKTDKQRGLNESSKGVKQFNTNNNNNNNSNKGRFTPPTLEQVTQYCKERNNTVDPNEFINHYETTNWHRGKTKIKNWQACVRTWEKNNKTPVSNDYVM